MSEIGKRIMEGGPVFMVPLVLMMLVIIVFFTLALMGKKNAKKMSALIGHLSLFGMIWGFLGSTMGLISAFDAIEAINDRISQPMFAGGLKVALLTTVFGLVVFLIGRAAMFALALGEKKSSEA